MAGFYAARISATPTLHWPGLTPPCTKQDVAAILGHGRVHPRIQKLLDLGDQVVVIIRVGMSGRASICVQQRLSGSEMLRDRAQDRRLLLRPVIVIGFRDGDELAAEEHAANAAQVIKPARQRRAGGIFPRRKVGCAVVHHGDAGHEFQCCRIGCLFGLYKHISDLRHW